VGVVVGYSVGGELSCNKIFGRCAVMHQRIFVTENIAKASRLVWRNEWRSIGFAQFRKSFAVDL